MFIFQNVSDLFCAHKPCWVVTIFGDLPPQILDYFIRKEFCQCFFIHWAITLGVLLLFTEDVFHDISEWHWINTVILFQIRIWDRIFYDFEKYCFIRLIKFFVDIVSWYEKFFCVISHFVLFPISIFVSCLKFSFEFLFELTEDLLQDTFNFGAIVLRLDWFSRWIRLTSTIKSLKIIWIHWLLVMFHLTRIFKLLVHVISQLLMLWGMADCWWILIFWFIFRLTHYYSLVMWIRYYITIHHIESILIIFLESNVWASLFFSVVSVRDVIVLEVHIIHFAVSFTLSITNATCPTISLFYSNVQLNLFQF